MKKATTTTQESNDGEVQRAMGVDKHAREGRTKDGTQHHLKIETE